MCPEISAASNTFFKKHPIDFTVAVCHAEHY